MSFAVWEGDHLILSLYIIPNAKSDEVVGLYDNALKLKITAEPQNNKANKAIKELLSLWFRVPKSQVVLIKGQQSRFKQFRIESSKILPAWLKDEEQASR